LLTDTKDGWRCGVDAERVRPFWNRALLFSGGAFLTLYLIGSIAIYAFFRTANYETRYLSVAWPPRWSELRGSQENVYAARAKKAIAARNYPEALLALERVCELNPRNYAAALALASLSQISGQPYIAEHIYERLMHDVPENRPTTAQIWIRPLLARAAYARIKPLATAMLTEDSGHREAWLHCLLFAARQTRDQAVLENLLHHHTGLPDWCTDLARIELLLLQDRREQALALLTRINHRPANAYEPFYQVDRLLALDRVDQAAQLIDVYGHLAPSDEVAFLRLRVFRAKKWTSLMEPEYDNLLRYPMTLRLAAQFSAWLVRQPEPDALARYADRFLTHGPPINSDTLPFYHATYLAASLSQDHERAERLATEITRFTASDAKALRAVAEVLLRPGNPAQLSELLPLVPLPLDVIYAILDRPVALEKK
jgi:tetratricopeptide (TPR) repeat protein